MLKRGVIVVAVAIVAMHGSVTMAYEKEIQEISSAITQNISDSGKKTIAVVDFTDLQGNMTELGRFLAEELSVDMTISAKGFDVVDRTHLRSILAEHKLSITGLVDPNTIKKLGQIAGVDAIVTGSVTPFGDSIRVTCKVVATDTAKVIGASKGDIAKTKAIEELLAKGIERIVPPGQSPTAGNTPPQRGSGDASAAMRSQDFPDLRVQVDRLIVEPNGVIVFLRFLNKDKEKINLWLDWNSAGRFLLDDKGNKYSYNRSSGIGLQGASCGGFCRNGEGLPVDPGAEGTAALTFQIPKEMRERGNQYDLSSALNAFTPSPHAFSVGRFKRTYHVYISDIPSNNPRAR